MYGSGKNDTGDLGLSIGHKNIPEIVPSLDDVIDAQSSSSSYSIALCGSNNDILSLITQNWSI